VNKMNSLEIMRRHLGKESEITLEDGETVWMSPLPSEFMPDLLVVQLKLDKGEINKELVEMIQKLIIESLKVSTPRGDLKDDEYLKLISDFAGHYYFKLSQKLFELNRGGMTEKDIEDLEKIRQKTKTK